MHLPWWTKRLWQLWQYSKCTYCPKMHSFTQAKTQLPTSWYCTMSVFCRTKCSNCKPTWYCAEIVLQSWTQQLQTFWHCTLIVLCIHYPIHGQVYTSKNNNCQPAGTVPCVFCSTRCKNCKAYGARMKLCCNYELNSCKLFDSVPCLLRSKELNCKLFGYVPSLTIFQVHSLPINAQFYTNKNNNCQPAGTVPWVCFAERISTTASRCGDVLRLFWANRIVFCNLPLFCRNERTQPNCIFLFFALLDVQSD